MLYCRQLGSFKFFDDFKKLKRVQLPTIWHKVLPWHEKLRTFIKIKRLISESIRFILYHFYDKKKISVSAVILTWDRLGWWELHRVLVSTCSGTNPWFLRTCKASLSLAGPKCGWITVFASAKWTADNKSQGWRNIIFQKLSLSKKCKQNTMSTA